ncbi:MAG: glycosyltransferase 87 family protein [Egibacteraceae bacterium]
MGARAGRGALRRGTLNATVLLAAAAAAGLACYTGVAAAALDGPAPGLEVSAGQAGRVYWIALAGGAAVLAAGMALASRAEPRAGLLLVLGAGALFRLVLVPTPPVLSDDLYRYLWDGRVQAAGINPYAHPPNAPELEPLRDEAVWPRINRPHAPTIYPPATQAVFTSAWWLGLRTPTAWKIVTAVVDIAAMLLLARLLGELGRDRRAVVAYAWNPMPVLAFGHSGHVDAFVVLGLVAAGLAWRAGALRRLGLCLGLAAAVKLYPLIALPAFVRDVRGRWSTRRAATVSALAVGVVAASYLPVATLGSRAFGYLTAGYLLEEGYTTGRRFLLFRALGLDGRLLGPLLLAAVVVVALRSRRPAPTRAAWVLGAVAIVTLSYPWYAAALVALAVAGGAGWAWPWLGVALETAYAGLIVPLAPGPLRFSGPVRVTAAAAIVLLALAATRWRWARRAVIAT